MTPRGNNCPGNSGVPAPPVPPASPKSAEDLLDGADLRAKKEFRQKLLDSVERIYEKFNEVDQNDRDSLAEFHVTPVVLSSYARWNKSSLRYKNRWPLTLSEGDNGKQISSIDHTNQRGGDLSGDDAWPGYGHLAIAQLLVFARNADPRMHDQDLDDRGTKAWDDAIDHWRRHVSRLKEAVESPRVHRSRDVWFAYGVKNNQGDVHEELLASAKSILEGLEGYRDTIADGEKEYLGRLQPRIALKLGRNDIEESSRAKLMEDILADGDVESAKKVWDIINHEGEEVDDETWERARRWAAMCRIGKEGDIDNSFTGVNMSKPNWFSSVSSDLITKKIEARIGGSDKEEELLWKKGLDHPWFDPYRYVSVHNRNDAMGRPAESLKEATARARIALNHPEAFAANWRGFSAPHKEEQAKKLASSSGIGIQVSASLETLIEYKEAYPDVELEFRANPISSQGRHKHLQLEAVRTGSINDKPTEVRMSFTIGKTLATKQKSIEEFINSRIGPDHSQRLKLEKKHMRTIRQIPHDENVPVVPRNDLRSAPKRSRSAMVGSDACSHENASWNRKDDQSLVLSCPDCLYRRIRVVPLHQVAPGAHPEAEIKNPEKYVQWERQFRVLDGQEDPGKMTLDELRKRDGYLSLDDIPQRPIRPYEDVAEIVYEPEDILGDGVEVRGDFDIPTTQDPAQDPDFLSALFDE